MSQRMVTIYGIRSKKEKKKLIQSKLRYPMVWERSIHMVWERSNKRDWDLHLKAGLFRSLYLCTHCHYLFDVSTNRLTCHVIFTNWNSPHMQSCVAIILPCSFSQVTHPNFSSYCLPDYDPFTFHFVCTLSKRLVMLWFTTIFYVGFIP